MRARRTRLPPGGGCEISRSPSFRFPPVDLILLVPDRFGPLGEVSSPGDYFPGSDCAFSISDRIRLATSAAACWLRSTHLWIPELTDLASSSDLIVPAIPANPSDPAASWKAPTD